jgi:hypothetical protein
MKHEMFAPYTISTLIPVKSAGSFGDGRCCHPSGYLQIALGLPPSPSPKSLRQFHQTIPGNGIMPPKMKKRRRKSILRRFWLGGEGDRKIGRQMALSSCLPDFLINQSACSLCR